ncbi:TCP-1/cpn60 chaperonin family protein [Chloroflexota bacterium]
MRKNNTPTVPVYKQTPGVVFPPETQRGFQEGIRQIVDSIRPSLGPLPRAVAIERAIGADRSPELLDSGGIIARRIIELPDRDVNAGAMFIRGALWNLHDRVGDGVATSAVLFQTIYDEGLKFISAGGNAMMLRRHLETGMAAIMHALDAQSIPLKGKTALAGVANAVCYDSEIAANLSEIFDVIGEYGVLDVLTGRHRNIERKFIAGSYWPGGIASKQLIADFARARTDFYDAAILVTDLEIEDPQAFMNVIRAAVEMGTTRLVVMARTFSDPVLGLFYQSKGSDKLQMLAVKTPGIRTDVQMDSMQEIAVLTGGELLIQAAGDTLEQVTPGHLGQARQIWSNDNYTGIISGQGDPRKLRTMVAKLRKAYDNTKKSEERVRIRGRIGRLSGGAASLEVGGITETEIETRKELAQRTVDALRGVVKGGVLPGGGVALLACRSVIRDLLAKSTSADQRAAHRILLTALETPFRTLVENAGYSPGAILGNLEGKAPSFGFDIQSGEVVDMLEAGILDVATVQKEALHSALRSASLALTIDTIVHRKKPPVVTNPDAPGI